MEHNMVGYGSLISHNSLKETINNKHFKPVIIKGYKRIFDIYSKKNANSDVLNIKKSKNSKLNGVMFKVNDLELEKIKKREDWYSLKKVKAYDFESGKLLGECFIVIDYTIRIDKDNKLPSKCYFILCREAAYHINKKFGNFWDKTTFTSDNETVSEWIKNHREYNTL